MKADLRGLRSILRAFDNTRELFIDRQSWSIAKGGYNLYWQLYYKGIPVIDCTCDGIENGCLDLKIFRKAAKIIMQEYSWVKINE